MKLFLLLLSFLLFSISGSPQTGILQNDDCFQTPKKFSASARVTTGVDYVTNAYQGQNNNLTRYYLLAEPQFKIGALPFATTFLISSENGAYSQNLSSFGIRFDAKGYSEHLKQKMKCKIENDNSYQRSMNRSKEMNYKIDSINGQMGNLKKEQENIGNRSSQLQSWKDAGYGLSYEQMSEFQSIPQRQTEISQQLTGLQNQKDALVTKAGKLNDYNNSAYINPSGSQIGDELKNRGALNGPEKFFLNTERLGIGKISLNYSELMLNGAVVEGGEFAYSPQIYSAGFAGGKTRFMANKIAPLQNNAIPSLNYRPFLQDAFFTTGHIGLGRSDGSHLHFRYVHIIDNATQGSLPTKTTGANDIAGASFSVPITKYIKVDGEYAHSFYSTDNNAPQIQNNEEDILSAIHKTNITTKKGNGYLLKAQFEKKGLNISAKGRYLEPGYNTLGVYYMNRARLMTDEKISYRLKSMPATFSINHSWMENTSTDRYSSKTIFEKYTGTVSLTPKNIPHWSISHTRYTYNTVAGTDNYGSTGKILTVTTSHNYKIKSTSCTSVLSAAGQKTVNSSGSDATANQTLFYSLSGQQNIRLNKGIVVSAGGTVNKTESVTNENYTSFANSSVLFPIGKKHQLEIFGRANFNNHSLYRISEGVNVGVQLCKNIFFKLRSEYIHWLNSGSNSLYQPGSFAGSAVFTAQW